MGDVVIVLRASARVDVRARHAHAITTAAARHERGTRNRRKTFGQFVVLTASLAAAYRANAVKSRVARPSRLARNVRFRRHMIDRMISGLPCRALRSLPHPSSPVRRDLRGRVRYGMENLGRTLLLVDWED